MNLLRAAATVSGFTLLSRITGLVRETLTATIFGAGPLTDAFFVAFRLPNLLRRLFAEGAFSQAFVPILAQARRQAEAGDAPGAPGRSDPAGRSEPAGRSDPPGGRDGPDPCGTATAPVALDRTEPPGAAGGGGAPAAVPSMPPTPPPSAAEAHASVRALLDHVATVLFWALAAVTVAGVAAAPALVWTIAGGLSREPAAFDAAVTMTRWMFPYILLISMVALAAGVLNTWKRFAVPAFTPVLLNLSFIAAALWLAPHFDPPVYALAAGVLLGGALQLALQVPALARLGLLPRVGLGLRAALADARVRRVLRQMAPAVLAVSVAQVSLLINTHIASRLAPGSVSWITYGDRLMEFPSALLGVALGSVLLPSLSGASAAGRADEYSALLDWGLRLSLLLAVPCALGLALAAEPLTALLFHYGRFDAHDVAMTARTIVAYGVGLPGIVAIKILAPGFYARQDVRTPVRIALVVLAATQLMNLALVPLFAHAGLALAISLGALANAALLLAGLSRRGAWRPAAGWGVFALRVALGSALLAGWLAYAAPLIDWAGLQARPALRAGLVLGLVGVGAALYLGALRACGLRPRDLVRRTG